MDDLSSTAAFLWKAAFSTIQTHPNIAANLMVKCRQVQNESQLVIKQKKISSKNACHYCGAPWIHGNYKPLVKQRIKTSKLKKLIKKETDSPDKLSKFEKHLLNRSKESNKWILVHCLRCKKHTPFPVTTPPPSVKNLKAPSMNVELSTRKKKKKKKKVRNAGLTIASKMEVNNGVLENSTKSESATETSNKATTFTKKKTVISAELTVTSQNELKNGGSLPNNGKLQSHGKSASNTATMFTKHSANKLKNMLNKSGSKQGKPSSLTNFLNSVL